MTLLTQLVFPDPPFYKRFFKSFIGRITGKSRPMHAAIEDIIYAYRIGKLESVNEAETDHITYFVLMTTVGLVEHETTKIKDVHIALKIKPTSKESPPIEIDKVAPNYETKEVGTVTIDSKKISSRGIDAQAGSEPDLRLLQSHMKVGGHITRKNGSEKVEKISYPKITLIRRSVGVGTDAIWEFKQGEIEGWDSEYDLNIYFRIRKPYEILKKMKLSYAVTPIIIINKEPYKLDEKGKVIEEIPLNLIGI